MKGNNIKSLKVFNSEIAAAAKYYESKKKERKGKINCGGRNVGRGKERKGKINYGGRNVGRGKERKGKKKKGPCWGLKSLPLILNFHF